MIVEMIQNAKGIYEMSKVTMVTLGANDLVTTAQNFENMVKNVAVPLVGGLALILILKSATRMNLTKILMSVAVAGALYYIVMNFTQVMDFVGNVLGLLFGF